MEDKPSKMLTVSEVASILHVHPNTLRNWCDQGLIKAHHIGPRGDRRFKVEDVYDFLEASRNKRQREELERAKGDSDAQYRALFHNTVDALIVVDAITRGILLANETTAKIGGFSSPDELIGINVLEFLFPGDREFAAAVSAEDLFEKNVGEMYEFRWLTREFTERWVEVIGSMIEYQGRRAGLVSLRDITDRKLKEKTLDAHKKS